MALSDYKIPKSNLAGGATGIILGTTGYLLSRKFCENKYAYPNLSFCAANELCLQQIIAYGRKKKLKKLLS